MNLKDVPKEFRKRKNGAVDGKKVALEWNTNAESAFNQLKEMMCSDLVLVLPNFDLEFEVTCDASDRGYGAVLEQNHFGINRPLAYFSRSLTKSQRNNSTSELD